MKGGEDGKRGGTKKREKLVLAKPSGTAAKVTGIRRWARSARDNKCHGNARTFNVQSHFQAVVTSTIANQKHASG
jgi:hypothetical protein